MCFVIRARPYKKNHSYNTHICPIHSQDSERLKSRD